MTTTTTTTAAAKPTATTTLTTTTATQPTTKTQWIKTQKSNARDDCADLSFYEQEQQQK
jgi:hypothetical protein